MQKLIKKKKRLTIRQSNFHFIEEKKNDVAKGNASPI